MKKLICVLSVFTLILTSCSSDSDSPANPEGTLLKKIIETEPGGDSFTTNFTYDGNKLVKTSDNEGYYEKYFYTGDVITKIEFYNDADELEQKELYTYNDSQQLITLQRLILVDGIGEKEVYTYNGSTVNVSYYVGDTISQTDAEGTSVVTFTNGEITSIVKDGITITYTYDTKNNVTKNILGFNKLAVSDIGAFGNNVNVLTEVHSSGTTVTTSYTYNDQNYPITCTEVDSRIAGTGSFQFFY